MLYGYTSPWMTPELEDLRKTARRFYEEYVAPNADKSREQGFLDRSIWEKAAELGLIGMSIKEEYGGLGASIAHELIMIEEQSRICDTTFPFIPGSLNSPSVFEGMGTPEQLHKWMPDIVAGKKILATSITEPDAGSDVKTLRTTARREGDYYVLNGSKTFCTLGDQADLVMVAARTGDMSTGARGISMFMVEKDKVEGFKINKLINKIGQNALNTSEIFLDDVRVPVENLLGGVEGKGFFQLMDVFVRERLSIGLVGISCAERAIELAVEHTKNRKMFGKTLWDFQNTQFVLAECLTEARIGRVFLDNIITDMVNGKELQPNDALMAKWWGSQKQGEIIDKCLQFFGGYGYCTEYPIAQLYMDARVSRIYGGSNETLKQVIARSM